MAEKNKMVSARVTKQLYSQVKEVSKQRGEDLSDFLRRALLKELARMGLLPENQMKALEVEV